MLGWIEFTGTHWTAVIGNEASAMIATYAYAEDHPKDTAVEVFNAQGKTEAGAKFRRMGYKVDSSRWKMTGNGKHGPAKWSVLVAPVED